MNSGNEEKQITDSQRILAKYPNKVPVIVDYRSPIFQGKDVKKKFLCPRDINLSHLLYIIRKHHDGFIKPSEALFCFIDNTLGNNTQLIGDVYDKYLENKKIKDGGKNKYMYVTIQTENTFGFLS